MLLCLTCLMLCVFSYLTCFVPICSRASHASCSTCPGASRAPCYTCFRPSQVLCSTCSYVSHVLCSSYSHISRASCPKHSRVSFALVPYMPLVPPALRPLYQYHHFCSCFFMLYVTLSYLFLTRELFWETYYSSNKDNMYVALWSNGQH